MTVQILHKRSAVEFKNANGGQLEFGEIALNYHESGPFLQCKDSAGEIINLGGVFLTDDAGDAPGDPLPGRMWLKGATLFIYDGNSWIGIASTGGGGGGGTSSLTVLGGGGIDATTIGDTCTVKADPDTSRGLEILGSKIAAKLGAGLAFDADGKIATDYTVIIDDRAPDPVLDGNLWWDSSTGDLYVGYTDPGGDSYWIGATKPGVDGKDGKDGNDGKDGINGIDGIDGDTLSVGDNSPSDPVDGQMWHNSRNGISYAYWQSSGVWVSM